MWLTNFQAEHPEVKRKKVRAADATLTLTKAVEEADEAAPAKAGSVSLTLP